MIIYIIFITLIKNYNIGRFFNKNFLQSAHYLEGYLHLGHRRCRPQLCPLRGDGSAARRSFTHLDLLRDGLLGHPACDRHSLPDQRPAGRLANLHDDLHHHLICHVDRHSGVASPHHLCYRGSCC